MYRILHVFDPSIAGTLVSSALDQASIANGAGHSFAANQMFVFFGFSLLDAFYQTVLSSQFQKFTIMTSISDGPSIIDYGSLPSARSAVYATCRMACFNRFAVRFTSGAVTAIDSERCEELLTEHQRSWYFAEWGVAGVGYRPWCWSSSDWI